jgi:midasin (ATPase involved in ribosome maturation)
VQSRVPVVIMGETGCGKTSLIKFFSQNILNDKLIIFNIHAGITASMILDKVYECI